MAAIGLVVAVVAAGCGGESVQTTEVPVLECPEPIPIAGPEDLISVLVGTDWRWVGPYSSGGLPVTPDLVVAGEVTIEAGDVPLPESCVEADDCLHEVAFFDSSLDGVMADGPSAADWIGGYGRLTISDTTVRLRPTLEDTHPGPYNSVPTVSVLAPCGSACSDGAALCPADGACYGTGGTPSAFCLFCEGKGDRECACSAEPGSLPDGTRCEFYLSGDVICTGECRDGVCVSEGC